MPVFKTLTSETKSLDEDRIDTRDYEVFNLNDLEDEDVFEGLPYLTEIFENEFEDKKTGKMTKKYSANLYLADTETEEKLRIRVNTKNMNDKQQAWQGSVLYDIIDSIETIHDPSFAGTNNVHTISFKELRDYINNLKYVKGTVHAHENVKNGFEWNTFRLKTAKVQV